MTPRKAAVLSLNSCIKNGKFINLELDSAIKKYGFEDKDKTKYLVLHTPNENPLERPVLLRIKEENGTICLV